INVDDPYSEQISVYNPVNATFINQIRSSELVGAYFNQIYWTPDDQNIVLAGSGKIFVLSPNGSEGRMIHVQSDSSYGGFGSLPHWFGDNRIAYLDPNESKLIIESNETGQKIVITLPNGIVSQTDWSPYEKYALMYIQPHERELKYQLWLVSIE